MKVSWQWSYEKEASRIIYACANIANGFYKNQGYLVLPSGTHSSTPHTTIILPDLPYHTIPRFWSTLSRIDFADPQPVKDQVIKPLISPLVSRLKLAKIAPTMSHPLQSIYHQHLPIITQELCHLLTLPPNSIKSLTIRNSSFGSIGSFEIVEALPAHVDLELRNDQGLRTLVNLLTQALTTRPYTTNYRATWKQIKFLSDWLITDSPLTKLLTPHDPLPYTNGVKALNQVTNTRSQITKSSQFLAKIGAPSLPQKFKLVADKIYYKNKPLLYLTPRENQIISSLITVSPAPLSLDELGDILFITPESYSLAVITKTIQHLRDKFEKNGVPGSTIKTIYGQGYALR